MRKLLIIMMVVAWSSQALSEDYTQPFEFCSGLTQAPMQEMPFYKDYLDGFIEALKGAVPAEEKRDFFSDVWELCSMEPNITVRSAARAIYMAGDK